MATTIHPLAIVGEQVQLGEQVSIGPFAVLEGEMEIGDGCVIKNNAMLYGPLRMGRNNVVYPGAIVGNVSQDLKYRGERTEVLIGDGNSIREYATIHQGTAQGGGKTVIGNNNLIMAYAHIAHDCLVGNHAIIVNGVQLAGHVIVHDYARVEGMVGVHQFATVGAYSFVGFMSRITKDVPPYMIVEGNPARECMVNVVGLQRAGFSEQDIALLRKAHRVLYRSSLPFAEKLAALRGEAFESNPHVLHLADFVQGSSMGKNGRAQGR
jgi:UDP-N-acetylglucosamine acyltransferase